MIVDNIKNCSLYSGIHINLDKAFDFLRKHLENPFADGRYEFDGNDAYAVVSRYETIPHKDAKWENHNNYLDIQFVRTGREYIGWAPLKNMEAATEYDGIKDVLFYNDVPGTMIPLADGDFVIVYPDDVHKPRCMWDTVAQIQKVVIKIRI